MSEESDTDSNWVNDPELKSLYQQALQSIKPKSVTGSPIPNHISKFSAHDSSSNVSKKLFSKCSNKPFNKAYNNLVVLTGNTEESQYHSNDDTKVKTCAEKEEKSRFDRHRFNSSDDSEPRDHNFPSLHDARLTTNSNRTTTRQSSYKAKSYDDDDDDKRSLSDVSIVDIQIGDIDTFEDNDEEESVSSIQDDKLPGNHYRDADILNLCDSDYDDCYDEMLSHKRLSPSSEVDDCNKKNSSVVKRHASKSSDAISEPSVVKRKRKKRKTVTTDRNESDRSKSRKHKRKKKKYNEKKMYTESSNNSDSSSKPEIKSRVLTISHSQSARHSSESPPPTKLHDEFRYSRKHESYKQSGKDDLRRIIERKRAKRW